MSFRKKRRPLCLAETADGSKCQNYRDTCPYRAHRYATSKAFEVLPSRPLRLSSAPLASAKSLADDPGLLDRLCDGASQHYDLESSLIEQDYWLVRSLFAWMEAAGGSDLPRPYLPPWKSASAGRVLFAGGTSLSAAWRIAPRWSEDIDLIVDPIPNLAFKKIRSACKRNAIQTSSSIGATCQVLEQGPRHFFFRNVRSGAAKGPRMDVAFRRLADVWVANRPVTSLIGRIADQDVRDRFPELGGFAVPTVGPGLTMTDKLLAQTRVAASGDLKQIRDRSRDLYDLACIALERSRFEGNIGRDTRRLLHISESQRAPEDPPRPADGFASLRTFDPSTLEYEALAEGYETVLSRMIWGDKIPLDEAIRLALSLDEGPAEEFTR